MANEAAWQSGWDMGSKLKRNKPKGPSQGSGSSPDDGGGNNETRAKQRLKNKGKKGQQGGGQLPWYTLGGLVQRTVLGSKKKGGRVRKTGLYLLHKGEDVVPTKHRSRKKAARKRTVVKA